MPKQKIFMRWIGPNRDQVIDAPAVSTATEDMAVELKRLRWENEILRQEREILKHTEIFSRK